MNWCKFGIHKYVVVKQRHGFKILEDIIHDETGNWVKLCRGSGKSRFVYTTKICLRCEKIVDGIGDEKQILIAERAERKRINAIKADLRNKAYAILQKSRGE
ncbi:MAG TPA: hypothetical protein DEG42_06230 [Acholeplasmataceae bacterium]|nr:hypothetical protein [Acholeplasmataceae bacterium]